MERELLMVELNSARIIREARQTKPYFVMTYAESDFVATHPNLNGNEKFLWTRVAAKSAPDKDYSCILTQGQIAELVGMSLSVVRKAISNLRKHGFLETLSTLGGPLKYFLTLPQKGLESILAVTNRKTADELSSKNTHQYLENRVPPVQNELPPRPIQTTPPSKMNDLYNIYNNINNNKHNHDAHSDFSPVDNSTPETDVQDDADALVCDFKNLMKEKYQSSLESRRAADALSHFTPEQQKIINNRVLELATISESQNNQSERSQEQRFVEKKTEGAPAPKTRPGPSEADLIAFEFDSENFLVEEIVKDKILSQIPELYNQKKIQGEAAQRPIDTLVKEIFFYVSKAGSKTLDTCQLKRFHVARKLCQKGAWERPNGLERQASIHREKQWQQAKIQENKFAQQWMTSLEQRVA